MNWEYNPEKDSLWKLESCDFVKMGSKAQLLIYGIMVLVLSKSGM